MIVLRNAVGTPMSRYYVVTPPYERINQSYYCPNEWGSDVVEVEAVNKIDAKVVGLRELRRTRSHWVQDMESDKRNPFNGLIGEFIEC